MRAFVAGACLAIAYLGTMDYFGMDFWPRVLLTACLLYAYSALYDRIGEKA